MAPLNFLGENSSVAVSGGGCSSAHPGSGRTRGAMKKPGFSSAFGQFHPGSRLGGNPDGTFPGVRNGGKPGWDFSRITEWGKTGTEYDGASDLSDSERIPIPPSPCTPPELILRAEEIDPVCLEHVPEMGFKESEYYYPDFLPPPFNSWDLKQLAIFVHVEGKTDFRPKPTGSLEKYIERLVQLINKSEIAYQHFELKIRFWEIRTSS